MANLVNSRQTAKTRALKYAWLQLNGIHSKQARQMRDWTLSHINQYLNAQREQLVAVRRTAEYQASHPQKTGTMKGNQEYDTEEL